MDRVRYVAVCGPVAATPEEQAAAREVGRLLASAGAVVLCGGLGGVMAAAAEGAATAGGLSVGLLPGSDRSEAAEHLTVALPTGLGEMRNALLVRAADGLVAVGGSWGTLSEVALACRAGLPVVRIGGWRVEPAVDGPLEAAGPAEAVELLLRLLG